MQMKTKSESTIGIRLTALIENLKLNPRQFALSIGADTGAMSRILSGENSPGEKMLSGIATKYKNVNLNWLLIGVGEMFTGPAEEVETVEETKKHHPKPGDQQLMKSVGMRLRQLRDDNKYTMEDMAKILDLNSHTAYAAIEYGKSFLSIPKLVVLSKTFKKTYNFLIHGVDHSPVPSMNTNADLSQIGSLSKELDAKDRKIHELMAINAENEEEIKLLNSHLELLKNKLKRN